MKNFIDSAIKSWKTTLIGFGFIGAALYLFVKGSPWENVAGAALLGVGMVLAKDSTATHSSPNTGA